MKKRRKKFALLMAGVTAVATCTFSCQQKSNTCLTEESEIVTTTERIAESNSTTATVTTTKATTTPKVTTATTTIEQIVATTTMATAYIADVDAIATTTEAIPETIVMPAETTTMQVQVQLQANTDSTESAVPVDEFYDEEPEQPIVEVYEQQIDARYLSNYTAPATYYVQDGDCLWTIACETGIAAEEIEAANPNVTSWEMIQPGDLIYLPVETFSDGYYVTVSGDCLSTVAEKMGYSDFEILTSNQQIDWDNLQIGEVVYAPMYVSNDETAEESPIITTEPEGTYDVPEQTEPMVEELPSSETVPTDLVIVEEEEVVSQPSQQTEQMADSNSEEEISLEEESIVVEAADRISNDNERITQQDESVQDGDRTLDNSSASIRSNICENDEPTENEKRTDSIFIGLVENPDIPPEQRVAYFYATTEATGASLRNIERSCEELDHMIVPAYETFSWFSYVGSCEDYEPAIIIDDSFVPTADNPVPLGNGGGICFTATCLRNAAEKLIGKENILEAHDHIENGVPKNMKYAPIGMQASINYPDWDFQFVNPFPEDILITCYFSIYTNTCYMVVSTGTDW